MIVCAMLINIQGINHKIYLIFFLVFSVFISYGLANDGLEIEIDSPKFSEKGLDNRLYEIKANRGIQKGDELTLYNVEGKLRTDTGIWIYLKSDQGFFNQSTNVIELQNNITFYTEENDRFESEYAVFNVNGEMIEFDNNIRHIKENSLISANKSRVKDDFNHIIYEGNVHTLYKSN